MYTIEITVIIAIVGCFCTLAAWLNNRDKRTMSDSEWRGRIDGKLDVIIGVRQEIEGVKAVQKEHGERLAKVESSASSAHHRIDELKE